MVVGKCAMDKGKSPVHLEEFQKDRDSPAHGASEETLLKMLAAGRDSTSNVKR